ncbi:MAG: YkvA family protein [Burkholderiaceae bacterium]
MTRKTLGLLGAARLARVHSYLVALWKLWRHPQTPRAAKWVAFAVLAYALSPIDLIPDFIPVLGQLDDLIIVPLGVALVVRLTPKPLWEALLREAEVSVQKLPRWRWAALLVLLVWGGLLALFVAWLAHAAATL